MIQYTQEQLLAWLTPYKTKPLFLVDVSGKKYDYNTHCTSGDKRNGDLPLDGYPYTIEYELQNKPLWL